MKSLKIDDVRQYVEDNIGTFHAKRLKRLERLKLDAILKRKNPYLFKAKAIYTPQDLVRTLLDAHLSSQEETFFGDFLEGLAIFINTQVYNGHKSAAEGIDLEFERDNIKYIVAIKSGPRMNDNFRKAKKILRTSNSQLNIIAVNGCCYGKDDHPDKGDYQKLCGQRFWEFISGNENLYIEIIEPLGHQAKERNEDFIKAYGKILTKFSYEFTNRFCYDGEIKWEKLVGFNSAKA
jgi:hypothetical protein